MEEYNTGNKQGIGKGYDENTGRDVEGDFWPDYPNIYNQFKNIDPSDI